MKKDKEQTKAQITFDSDAYSHLQKILKEANQNFEDGSVNMSDCVNFAVLNAKYNIADLQKKSIHTTKLMQNVYQELKQEDAILVEALLKVRSEIRSKKQRVSAKKEDSHNET